MKKGNFFIIMIVIFFIKCKVSKDTIIIKSKDSILEKEIISINSISDTFSINCYSKRVLIDKTKYTTDYFEYMDITNCLSDMAFQGDTNAISAIIKHVNHKNFMGYKRFAASPRGKRLFEHILYNIASEIYCGNPYADETMGNEGISPGMDELMEMVKHWPPEEDQLREIFTEKVKSERNEKYTHLMTIDERGFPKWEACRYVSVPIANYWIIKVAYEGGLLELKDFGER